MPCFHCQQPNRPTAHFCARCGAPLRLENTWRVVRLLGRGGFGAVYLAEHLQLAGTYYALKELLLAPGATLAERQQAESQFQLEARLLAQLAHPTLPKVWHYFSENNRQYLVMEYVPGDTLAEQLERIQQPMPEAEVRRWADELCDALTFLHSQKPSIVHRDINPRNIKLLTNGHVKLLDFGIAKLMQQGGRTGPAAHAVSPPYSPLEQYGVGTDTRSDIYALGATLYHLVTNRPPPDAPDRVNQPLAPPRQLNPALSAAMDACIVRAMELYQPQRYQTAAEMQYWLRRPSAPPPPPPSGKTVTVGGLRARGRGAALLWLVPLTSVLVLILGASVVGWNIMSQSQATATANVRATAAQQAAEATRTFEAQASRTAANATALALNVTATASAQRATQTASAQETASAQAIASQTAQARRTATAQIFASATAAAQATLDSRRRETEVAQSVQRTVAARATETRVAQIHATETAAAEKTAAAARRNASATARARLPFGENFTFGRDHIEDDCTVAIQTTTIAQSAFADDEWLYFASPFRADQVGSKLYWTVSQPNASPAFENEERELASDKKGCFWQGFGLGNAPPTGVWRLKVEYQSRTVYEIQFRIN